MLKTTLFWLSLAIVLIDSPALQACEALERKVERYTQLRRNGGNASQMTRWQKARHKYKERYHECRRQRSRIHSYSRPARRYKPSYRKPNKITGSDARTRKMERTCNFWIREYNRAPSPQFRQWRETACRAAAKAQTTAEEASTTPASQRSSHPVAVLQRPLEECIKPDELIDNQVLACMEGRLEPEWNTKLADAE